MKRTFLLSLAVVIFISCFTQKQILGPELPSNGKEITVVTEKLSQPTLSSIALHDKDSDVRELAVRRLK